MKKTRAQITAEREKVFLAVKNLFTVTAVPPSFDELSLATGLAKSVVRLRLLELSGTGRLTMAPKKSRTILMPSKTRRINRSTPHADSSADAK